MQKAAEDFDCDLLIVGLGPTGVTLAALARQHGLSVIAIDREAGLCPHPRAAAFDAEIMRIFQELGVAETIAATCRVPERYEFIAADGDVLLDFPLSPLRPEFGWADSYLFHQPAAEGALRARAAALGADLRLATSLTGLAQDSDGVKLAFSGPQGAGQARARFLVGCDGASSAVRQAIGAPLFDYAFDESWLVIDALCEAGAALPCRLMQLCDPARPTSYMKMAGDRYRWEFMLLPGEDPAELAGDASVRRLLAAWHCADSVTLERRAVYRFHAVVATEWRAGRVLLAGDAAHQMPPFAGQGMCSGLRDAANLAWKLAMVIGGGAADAILDTYQQERAPHVRAIIERAIAMGRVVCILDAQQAATRDAGMKARRAAGAADIALDNPPLLAGMLMQTPAAGEFFPQPVVDGVRLDDVLPPGARLFTSQPSSLATAAADIGITTLDDPALAGFAPAIAAWLTNHDAEAVLMRPDRQVFGTGSADMLVAAWDRAKRAAPPQATNSAAALQATPA